MTDIIINNKEYIVYPVYRSGWKYVTKVHEGFVFSNEMSAEVFLDNKKSESEGNSNLFWYMSPINRGE